MLVVNQIGKAEEHSLPIHIGFKLGWMKEFLFGASFNYSLFLVKLSQACGSAAVECSNLKTRYLVTCTVC